MSKRLTNYGNTNLIYNRWRLASNKSLQFSCLYDLFLKRACFKGLCLTNYYLFHLILLYLIKWQKPAKQHLSCIQHNSKSSAFAEFRVAHVNGAFMVFVDDAFYQRESQSPAAFFGGETGFKYGLKLAFRDAFTGVCNVEVHVCFVVVYAYAQIAVAFHGIYGVFA